MELPSGPLVTADWLRQHLDEGALLLVDIRYYMGDPPGERAYLSGHIPGAVFLDFDRDITGSVGQGRHPLPTQSQFQAAMRRIGATQGSRIVAYDDAGGSIAGRLWWLLRYFGHRNARVLDGGVQAWEGPMSSAQDPVVEGDFVAAVPRRDMVIGYEEVRNLTSQFVLLDARAPERFTGESEPIDSKAGHIPGAISSYWKLNLDPTGKFLPTEELRARFAKLGVTGGSQVVAYCGSGGTACHNLLALEIGRLPGARLYAGSWSDWITHDDAPIAVGAAEYAS
jgi:thiosulfate/3-mercaptopyruvate sulfurtransferase